jgi:hypothetical protein
VTARVYTEGKRLALGAGASGVRFIGDAAMFALTDGAVLVSSREGENKRIEAHGDDSIPTASASSLAAATAHCAPWRPMARSRR